MGALLLLASCTDDYKDWIEPQTNAQPETIAFADGSVSPVGVINFADFVEGQALVKVCNLTAPTATDTTYAPEYTIAIGDKTFDIDSEGRMAVSDLVTYVESNFGKAPTQRDVQATVSMWLNNGGTSVKMATSAPFTISAIPDAPFIDPNGYYLVGNIDSWACKLVDAYHLVNNGGDVYANPTFTITLAAIEGVDPYEIKIVPASAFAEDGSISNWDIALSALPDVDEIANSGMISYSNAGGNIKFAADANAKFYTISVNLMEGTYNVEAVSFAPYIYEAGCNNGWGSYEQPLYSANGDGVYTGYFYAQTDSWTDGKGAFKFRGAADNWDQGNYGTGTLNDDGLSGSLINDSGSGNIMVEPGFYRAVVNLGNMTFQLTPITIGIIGPAQPGNWDTDTDLTYNPETYAWEATIELAADEFKFRANDDWAINWGGTADNLTQDGPNLKIDEAGTYFIQLFITCDGNYKAILTKQ